MSSNNVGGAAAPTSPESPILRRVLVTGARGFIGMHVVTSLRERGGFAVVDVDVDTAPSVLEEALLDCEVLIHLAGVNRPQDPGEYDAGNARFTATICERLTAAGNSPLVVFSSSAQVEDDNPYGRSKLAAEQTLREWSREADASVVVFRLPNVFGKWSRPDFNSVVATFCHNVAHDKPIRIDDADRVLHLVYIDDVVRAVMGVVESPPPAFQIREVEGRSTTTVGELAALIRSFRVAERSTDLPDFGDRFVRRLHATYLSFGDVDQLAHDLDEKSDARGALWEVLRQEHFGQVFVSRTRPGITRGNHYHHTKTERFLVIEGEGVIRLRKLECEDVVEYPVSGARLASVTIPPGMTHSIENVGSGDMLTLFWSNEVFDAAEPDTFFEMVLQDGRGS